MQSEHFVQLFDSKESLADSVSAYLAPAYAAGENLLIVAKPKHWEAIAAALAQRLSDVADGLKSGRITVLDAVSGVRSLCRNEMPDAARFDKAIGSLVRTLSTGTRLTVYGEMVEVLAEEGNFAAVLKLEDLWNAVLEKIPVRLMCGYSSAHFASPQNEAKLRRVCKAHEYVTTRSEDPLAAWLVERTRLPFRPDLLSTN